MCEVSHMLHTLQTLLGMHADIFVTAYPANVETIAGTVEQVWDKQTHLQLHPVHQG